MPGLMNVYRYERIQEIDKELKKERNEKKRLLLLQERDSLTEMNKLSDKLANRR